MKTHRNTAALAFGIALVAGCFPPRFEVRDPPTLTLTIPRAPQVPEARQVQTAAGNTAGGEAIAAHPLPDLRAQTLAVVLEADDALSVSARRALPRLLIERRLTRVIYPDVQAVLGSLERGVQGDRTTVNGTLPQLALLQARTPADHLLVVHIEAQGAERTREQRFEVPAGEMATYQSAWAEFHAAVDRIRSQLRSVVPGYQSEVAAAEQRYRSAGGNFLTSEDQQARGRVEAWQSQAAQLERNLTEREQSVPSPDDLATRATTLRTAQREATQRVELRAVLTDLRAGETFWCDLVHGEAPSAEEALRDALRTLLQDLGVTP